MKKIFDHHEEKGAGSPYPGVAVVGSGYWGRNLVRNYHHLGVLKAICDLDRSTLEDLTREYPGTETCDDFHCLISRNDIHGIVIATPAETHFDLAIQAIEVGKHVYIEKPLVLDEAEGKQLVDSAQARSRILMVGHLLQYHPAFVKLRQLAAAGELGRMNYIYSHRLNLGKIRREENSLWSFAPHDISMILSLTGETPTEVFATGGNFLHRQVADVTTTHLSFPSGRKAHIFVSWLHPFKEQKLVVVGDRKMAVFDDTRPWEEKLLLYPHRIDWKDNLPVAARAEAEAVPVSPDEPLRIECEHFLECIRTGGPPRTDGREGLRVLQVLRAAQDSLDLSERQGQKRYKTTPGEALERRQKEAVVAPTPFFVHPSAVVEENVQIGEGTRIWLFTHVLSGARIGTGCNIGQNVSIDKNVVIGNRCKIQNNVSVYQGVTLEDGVFCGPSMVFTNVFNPRAEIAKMDQARPTLVKKGATIGANATIVCGVTIGRYAFVGAGAVVTKDVSDHSLVLGNPAQTAGWVCGCGERLPENLACMVCHRRYRIQPHGGLGQVEP